MSSIRKTNPRKLYRRSTAAALLDTSIHTLRALEQADKLTPVRLGKRDVYYPAEQVDALCGRGGDNVR